MRFLIKMLIMCSLVVGLTSYGGYLMTGKPLWDFAHLPDMPDLNILQNTKKTLSSPNSPPASDTVYKWTAADGTIQYSSEPPPEDMAIEVLNVDPNINVIAAVKAKEPEKPEPSKEPNEAEKDEQEINPPGYSPERIKQVMDDAKNVQQLLNDRNSAQQKALDSL